MFDSSNTPVAVRAEDQPLIEAINKARSRYRFSDAAVKQLLDDFTNPEPSLKTWIVDLCDQAPRADPFVTSDYLAGFTREVVTRGKDYGARWADLTTTERRLARRFKRFAQDKRRVRMGAGPPRNVDPALVLYVIRRIEEATEVLFRFARPKPFCLGGPMLRLAEAALLRLFHIADDTDRRRSRVLGYLGWGSPARHYTRWEIARTAQLARRARRMSPASPANWQSDLILAFPSDVRSELVDKAIQENKDQGSASPSLRGIARELLEAAIANGRETRLKYGSGLDVLQANLKSDAQPDLIEEAKIAASRVRQEEQPASTPRVHAP